MAIIFAAVLTQQAWNRQESLTAVAHLAFYHQQSPQDRLTLAILDVNGDSIPEGLVRYEKTVPKQQQQQHSEHNTSIKNEWKLQVLDVGPLQRRHKTHFGVPFSTDIVLESEAIRVQDIIQPHSSMPHEAMEIKPLSIISGHVNVMQGMMRPKQKSAKKSKRTDKVSPSDVDLNDRNRHFFCGTDWHDAVKKCGVPCPKGTASECPDGEKCYADTPCDYDAVMNPNSADERDDEDEMEVTSLLADANNVTRNYHLTPEGGLPSVVTLWSNGLVTLHSIAASKQADNESSSNKKDMKMRIQLMWKNRIFPLAGDKFVLAWEEQTLSFVSALDAGNGCGLILVSGRLSLGKEEGDYEEDLTVLVAMNAQTGEIEWRSNRSSEEDTEEEAVPDQPIHRGTSSMARRRSLIPNLQRDPSESSSSAQHCLTSFYRRPLLKSSSLRPPGGALPFSYWTEEDASIRTIHIDLEQPTNNREVGKKKPKKKKRGLLQYGKPNVVVTHDGAGLQLRSLRNGRSLCHLALSEERLYADFNHDGTLDSVHIALGSHFLRDLEMQQDEEDADDDYRFISGLAKRMMEKEQQKKKKEKTGRNEVDTGDLPTKTDLCHLVALSGFPSKEELFSFRLCNPNFSRIPVYATAPLLVEPMYGKGWDIIAAVNTGSIHRIRGATGWNQWKFEGKDEFPSWNHAYSAVLGRVETDKVLPAMRPIVLTGETGLAILSVETGTLLASAKFPQRAIRRATFIDFDGDGTTDVIVQTNDAIWGYKIVVGTGSSVFLRILVGLLLMGLLLAMLRNRFGPTPGKRSTDS